MRTLTLLLSLPLFGAACTASRRVAPPTSVATRSNRSPRAPHAEVALFVRDGTEESLRLTSLIEKALAGRGIRCRVTSSSVTSPPWSSDAPIAIASGARFAVRVTVVTRRRQEQSVHRVESSSRPATGLVVGPTADEGPADFPELRSPGGRERIDTGPTALEQDLRLEVIASLRSVAESQPVARWDLSEGSLALPGATQGRPGRDNWEAVYGALADRLADLLTDAMATIP